jgi:hypothetical protein
VWFDLELLNFKRIESMMAHPDAYYFDRVRRIPQGKFFLFVESQFGKLFCGVAVW